MSAATEPEISVLVTTFERPDNLRRVLESLAVQRHVGGQFEVIVCDDGSRDETPELVKHMQTVMPYPLRFVTHRHEGFQPSRCRNEGALAAQADYLLFLDGDCIVPPDHLWQHLQHRQPRTAMAGYCYWFDQTTSRQITTQVVRWGQYLAWTTWRGMWDLWRLAWKSRFYEAIRHPTKPKLYGGNAGIWRTDYERINGYDQNYVGWGCEDDDFRIRLRRSGVRIRSILKWTRTYHLWHPRDPSAPQRWSDGPNVAYYHRSIRLTRCRHGMRRLRDEDIIVRVVGMDKAPAAAKLVEQLPVRPTNELPADVEIAFMPGGEPFSGRADCNVLVLLDETRDASPLMQRADILVSDRPCKLQPSAKQLPLRDFPHLLKAVA